MLNNLKTILQLPVFGTEYGQAFDRGIAALHTKLVLYAPNTMAGIAMFVDHFIAADPADEYGRSKFTQDCDEMAGVNTHQLDVRYGRVIPEVVKPSNQEDWVDRLEHYLDKRLAFIIHQP